MTGENGPGMKPGLPVEVERLREAFPDLSDADLQAYAEVTRRVLGDPAARARTMRDILERAREAQQRGTSGGTLSEDQQLLVRYLSALAKMQRSTVRRVP